MTSMKNILFLLFISTTLVSFSQFTIVDRKSTNDYTSDTLVLDISPTNKEYTDFGFLSVYFDISNSVLEREIVIKRELISIPAGWHDLLCWGTGCYDPQGETLFSTPDTVTCKTDGTSYELKPEVSPNDIAGKGHFRYVLVDVNDEDKHIDSVDLIVNFGVLDVKEVENPISFSINPNPSSDYIYINVDSNSEMDFKVVDVLGNVVLQDVINNSKKVNVSNYKNGLYFITISSKDRSIVTRKMIVKH